MLIDPSLEMISDFLIMAFYMLGACNRNAGYMYLGVASKAANALGLHRIDQYRDIPDEECRLRFDFRNANHLPDKNGKLTIPG